MSAIAYGPATGLEVTDGRGGECNDVQQGRLDETGPALGH
jgi:hypothetical protein